MHIYIYVSMEAMARTAAQKAVNEWLQQQS